MIGRTARWCLLCLLAGLGMAADNSESANIKVRVISVKNGKPMAGKTVRLSVTVPHGERGATRIFDARQTTGPDGAALFHVAAQPAGAVVWLSEVVPDYWCSPGHYHLDRVLESGVAERRGCPHRSSVKYVVEPAPGQIVLYFGEYSRLERILYFPWPT